jgi:hypothetical protein
MMRELEGHLAVYVTTSLLFNFAWLVDGDGRFYWPIIPMTGWGIALALYAGHIFRLGSGTGQPKGPR